MVTAAPARDRVLPRLWPIFGFTPNRHQAPIILAPRRQKLVAGGIRAGKSYVAGGFLTGEIVYDIMFSLLDPEDTYWIVGPNYRQTRFEFNYVANFLARASLLGSRTKNVNPGLMTLAVCPCGMPFDACRHEPVTVRTLSATDHKGLSMEAPRAIVVTEAAQIDLESFWRVDERALEKDCPVFMSGTFETSLGWYQEKANSWKIPSIQEEDDGVSFILPSYTNLASFPGGVNDPKIVRRRRRWTAERFAERIEGVAMPPPGRVYHDFRNHIHVRDVHYADGYPVFVWVDWGYSEQTESAYAVLMAQMKPKPTGEGWWVEIFDEVFVQGMIAKEVCQMASDTLVRPWWAYAEKRGVIDVSGKTHPANTSQMEVWMQETGLYLHPQGVERVEVGIERVRTFLKVNPNDGLPGLVVAPKCTGLISEMGGGPNPFDGQAKVYSYPTEVGGRIRGTKPRNRYNHACDALAYGLVYEFSHAREAGPQETSRIPVTYR